MSFAELKIRFRWAVCQIDVLQRLKGEREIIKSTLANLPKGLYETYDRVTTEVPEDEQIFVQHTLYWICYHFEIYGEQGILWRILLEAVARSTSSQGIDLNARYYDLRILQETCGCLIEIIPPYRRLGSSGFENVAFAHFTVREYLDASRYHMQSVLYSAKCKISLWREFKLTTLNGACCVERNRQWEMCEVPFHVCTGHENSYSLPFPQGDVSSTDYRNEIIHAMESNFNIYSLASAIILLKEDSTISEEPCLIPFIFDVVNPYRQNWKTVKTIIEEILSTGHDDQPHYENRSGWEIFWDDETSTPYAAALVNITYLVTGPSTQACLVRRLLRHGDADSLIRSHTKFTKLVCWTGGYEQIEQIKVEGPLSEVLINVEVMQEPAFEVLLDYGRGFSDPSKLLIVYLTRSHIFDFDSVHLVERLLRNGANPNTSHYHITPLQLAAVFRDTEILKVLLTAGADPNGTIDVNDRASEFAIFKNQFNILAGASPLWIFTNFPYFGEQNKCRYKEGEAFLIEHGARTFLSNRREDMVNQLSQLSPPSFEFVLGLRTNPLVL